MAEFSDRATSIPNWLRVDSAGIETPGKNPRAIAVNRAAGATVLLKSVGFKYVVYANDGMISLVTNLTPMTAPTEQPPIRPGAAHIGAGG